MKRAMLVLAVLMLAACGSPKSHAVTVARATHSAAPSATPTPTLTCGTDVDTSQNGSPLTVTDVIGNLDAVMDTSMGDIALGDLDNHTYSVLTGAETDLDGYAGNKLSVDGAQFSQDEFNYMPNDNQSDIDKADATPMLKDILRLTTDCPGSLAVAKSLTSS